MCVSKELKPKDSRAGLQAEAGSYSSLGSGPPLALEEEGATWLWGKGGGWEQAGQKKQQGQAQLPQLLRGPWEDDRPQHGPCV